MFAQVTLRIVGRVRAVRTTAARSAPRRSLWVGAVRSARPAISARAVSRPALLAPALSTVPSRTFAAKPAASVKAESDFDWDGVREQFRQYNAARRAMAPPIRVAGKAGEFAASLYTAAHQENSLDATAKALATLISAVDSVPEVTQLFKEEFDATRMTQGVPAVLTALQLKNAPLSSTLNAMIRARSLRLINEVAAAFTLMQSGKSTDRYTIVVASVHDAVTLYPMLNMDVISADDFEIDPSIEGGFIIKSEGRLFDYSTKNRRELLYEQTQKKLKLFLERPSTPRVEASMWTTEAELKKTEEQAWTDAAAEVDKLVAQHMATLKPVSPLDSAFDLQQSLLTNHVTDSATVDKFIKSGN